MTEWLENPLLVFAIAFVAVSLVFFALGTAALRRRRPFRFASHLLLALLMLSLGGLFATVAVATQGYRALTREEVAVVVTTRPTGPQRFDAAFRFPDGREASYSLAGDEFYVDAHILKWKPVANLVGLHTGYELDRVAGRYLDLEDERVSPFQHSQPSLSRLRLLVLSCFRAFVLSCLRASRARAFVLSCFRAVVLSLSPVTEETVSFLSTQI